jgi:tetratricopeptide (TPR) repeat protein
MIVISAVFAPVNADKVGNKNRKANRLYAQEKYEEALKLYDEALEVDPTDGKLKMNRGSTLYRLNEFDEAENSYLDALNSILPKDKNTLADAHYNLGNIRYRQGEQLESEGDAASARGKYSQALEDYISTLKLRPDDKDAKWNLQLAHQKVQLIEEQQEERQGQDGDEGDDDKKQDDGGQGDKKDENQKDEQGSDQDGDGQDQDEQDQNEQTQEQQPQNQEEQDIKKDEAERLIEQYADDADTLNKPKFQRGKIRQPEKDW